MILSTKSLESNPNKLSNLYINSIKEDIITPQINTSENLSLMTNSTEIINQSPNQIKTRLRVWDQKKFTKRGNILEYAINKNYKDQDIISAVLSKYTDDKIWEKLDIWKSKF